MYIPIFLTETAKLLCPKDFKWFVINNATNNVKCSSLKLKYKRN